MFCLFNKASLEEKTKLFNEINILYVTHIHKHLMCMIEMETDTNLMITLCFPPFDVSQTLGNPLKLVMRGPREKQRNQEKKKGIRFLGEAHD